MTIYTWNGVTADWSVSTDWTPSGPPNSPTAIVNITATGSYTVTIASTESFKADTVTLDDSSATLAIDGTLTTAGNFTNTAGTVDVSGLSKQVTVDGGFTNAGTLDVDSGSSAKPASLTISGQLNNTGTVDIGDGNVTAGSFAQSAGLIEGAGTLTVTGAATFSGSDDQGTGTGTILLKGVTTDNGAAIYLDGGYVLANGGTFDVTNGATFTLGYYLNGNSSGSATIENNSGGTFDFQTAASVSAVYGTDTFVNAGTLEQTVTTGTTDIGVTVTNTGTVSVQAGTLEFSGGGSSTDGTYTLASGATLEFGGGTFTLSGDTFSGAGVAQLSGGALAAGGNSTIGSGFAQTGGALTGPDTITVTGAATFSGNDDQGTGTGTILLKGVTTDNGAAIYLDGGYVLANGGTFDVTNGATFTLGYYLNGNSSGSATIENNSGGTFDFQTAASVSAVYGTDTFVNAGTLEQTVTTGTTDIGVTVTNTGTVSVQAGTLEFSGGGSSTDGTYTLASGATLEFGGGTFTLSGDTFSGAGVAQLSGGALAAGGNSTIGSGFAQTGGALTGPDTITVTGAATFSGNDDQGTGTGTILLKGVTTDNGAAIYLDGGYVLANGGTFDVTNGATFTLGYYLNGNSSGSATIENNSGGTFDFQTAASVSAVYGTDTFVNAGTLEQTVTTGTTDIGVTVTNTGTVSVQAGTLEFSGGGSSTDGTYTLASGATLEFGGGTFTLSGDTFSGAGVAQLSGGALAAGGNSTIGSGFAQTGGALTGPDTITVTGAATFSGNDDQGTGTGTILLKGVTTDNGAAIYLDGGYVLANGGTFDVTNGATFTLGYYLNGNSSGSATIENNSGGTFDFQTAASVSAVYGTDTFVNAGTLEQTVTTSTTDIGVTFTNTGTVSVQTGTLEFSDGVSSTGGTFTTTSAGTLDFSSGTFTMSGVAFTGSGAVDVSSGITLDFVGGASTISDASIEAAGTLLLSGGNTTIKSGATVSIADFSESGSGTSLTIGETLAYAGDFIQGASSTIAISKGDELSLTGTARLGGTTSGAGTLSLAGGSTTIASGASLKVSNWSISGADTGLTLDENLTYAGLFTVGAGDTLVLSGGHLLLSGAATFAGGTVDGSDLLETKGTTTLSGLTIGGTMEWENTKTVNESGGSATIGDSSGDKAFLDNTATAAYDILDDSGIVQGNSASYIKNAGLFEKTGGTGTTSTIAPAVTNTGTLEVSVGTLDFQGKISGTGTDTISGASTLEFGAAVGTAATLGNQDIGFTGGGTLDLLAPKSFYGEISNFGPGDTVELQGSWAFSGFSENSGATLATLTLVNGAATHAFDFVGDYAQGDFKITSGSTTTITYT